ncbi:MAG TPA: LLM class flavin-dependent oxidoreductase [Dehalococcoidia bacterium]|jgi:F420-dependent oxidoreductase-like protein|nr:LLM class flavin-dependent oxidoreductase [Dehalococcoidia bacterium]
MMGENIIGLAVGGNKVVDVQAAIEQAEKAGVQAAWMTTGGARLDSITTFAAAAGRSQTIKFGTSVVPTYPRHPLVMVQQAQVVGQLAPGRFRLGIGPSHRPTMRAMGIQMPNPLGHLRDYLKILKALLQTGKVDYDGEYYQAHDSISEPVDVKVMASALQRNSFELCGAEADGAISWVCPAAYLKEVALPAMKKGAADAGRPVPPLIAHLPVCVHDNVEEVRSAFREQFPVYPTLPFYRRMLVSSGYPEAAEKKWSDAMMDGLVVYGDETKVAEGIKKLFADGAGEILVSPVLAGNDRDASLSRTLKLLGQVAQSGS